MANLFHLYLRKIKSQLTFVALVLGGVTPLYADDGAKLDLFIIVTGAILTLMFASVGSRILK